MSEAIQSVLEGFRQALTRRSMLLLDERIVLARIAKKVERAADRMGRMAATGTQAVVRCGGRVFENPEWKIVETKKGYVN